MAVAQRVELERMMLMFATHALSYILLCIEPYKEFPMFNCFRYPIRIYIYTLTDNCML